MKGASSFADAEHSVEWQVNLTHALIVVLVLYVVWKTDVLEGVAASDQPGLPDPTADTDD